MVKNPRVSIITPTWQRNDLLLTRCIPSVQAQDYANLEHVIVSDGPDPELRDRLLNLSKYKHLISFYEIPERVSEIRYGTRARRYALERATGNLIGYNDDDDALRPTHVSKLVAALEQSGASWARAQMIQHHANGSETVIGNGQPACGNIGTPMVVHKRRMLDIANWGNDSQLEDWELYSQWVAVEPCELVNEVTVDAWPSIWYGG